MTQDYTPHLQRTTAPIHYLYAFVLDLFSRKDKNLFAIAPLTETNRRYPGFVLVNER